MHIRVGYELVYRSPQPTPMILMLSIHYSRVSDLAAPDHMIVSPALPVMQYRDGFGNWCSRLVAPAGQMRLTLAPVHALTGECAPLSAEIADFDPQLSKPGFTFSWDFKASAGCGKNALIL